MEPGPSLLGEGFTRFSRCAELQPVLWVRPRPCDCTSSCLASVSRELGQGSCSSAKGCFCTAPSGSCRCSLPSPVSPPPLREGRLRLSPLPGQWPQRRRQPERHSSRSADRAPRWGARSRADTKCPCPGLPHRGWGAGTLQQLPGRGRLSGEWCDQGASQSLSAAGPRAAASLGYVESHVSICVAVTSRLCLQRRDLPYPY